VPATKFGALDSASSLHHAAAGGCWTRAIASLSVRAVILLVSIQAALGDPDVSLAMRRHEEHVRQQDNFWNAALLIVVVVIAAASICIRICFKKWRIEVAALKKLETTLQEKSTNA